MSEGSWWSIETGVNGIDYGGEALREHVKNYNIINIGELILSLKETGDHVTGARKQRKSHVTCLN